MHSTTTMEDVANSAPNGLRWFQLYYVQDRKFTKSIIQRAEKAGYKALLLTVDSAIYGAKADITADIPVVHFEGATDRYTHFAISMHFTLYMRLQTCQ